MTSVKYVVPGLLLLGLAGCETRRTEEGREITIKNEDLREVEREARRDIDKAIDKADEKLGGAKEKAKETAGELKNDAEELTYGARVDRRMASLDEDIARLEADVSTADERAREGMAETLRDLKLRRADLQRDVDAIESTTNEDLERLRTRIDRSVDALENDVAKAAERLRGGASRT